MANRATACPVNSVASQGKDRAPKANLTAGRRKISRIIPAGIDKYKTWFKEEINNCLNFNKELSWAVCASAGKAVAINTATVSSICETAKAKVRGCISRPIRRTPGWLQSNDNLNLKPV